MDKPDKSQLSVAVVGAGAAGLCMGVKLRSSGFENFVIYERASEVGGVWRDNTYPGLTCDVPSRAFTFSFSPNSQWSDVFSKGTEISAYLRQLVDRHQLGHHLRVGEGVEAAHFLDGQWQLTTTQGSVESYDILLCATGLLVNPRVPDIPGISDFTGAAFHSADWEHSVSTAGKRVAVIGSGSTGTQLTCSLAAESARFLLFQRTAQWVFPLPNRRYSALNRTVHGRWPWFQQATHHFWRAAFNEIYGAAVMRPGWRRSALGWVCRAALRRVRDPQLRAQLTPPYQPMCKRLVAARGFYRAMQLPHVDLVTEAIDHVTAAGIVTRDGREHAVDVLVFATGFRAEDYMRPMELTGRDGITLDEVWAEGPYAYNTVALPGFPNLFMLVGPHSPFSHDSVLGIAETHADYILKWLELFDTGQVAEAEPTQEATARFNDSVRAAMPGTIFTSGCSSWYHGPDGNPMVWPWPARQHRELLAELRPDDFELRPRRTAAVPEPVQASR
ncbi:flavin-containing monooxygenase [Kitasatospora kifunensis]|uniref:Cation diffusion facilitator CzcD-associated flavoprotein CzcO n=1 Tax=Kitasatospora kifunensis TaxID=58351 RepID=A0A7W7R951_KITKI|nr:NAD(P)/FAD-dependent oxidoreductase [Kitasatospora kifunensis]MBB4927530.1 cation diffusion facilitator CzcD-associated flavoprotein CzcO [Kitasatospora kifunensis]